MQEESPAGPRGRRRERAAHHSGGRPPDAVGKPADRSGGTGPGPGCGHGRRAAPAAGTGGSRSCGARPPEPSCQRARRAPRHSRAAPPCSRAALRVIRAGPVTGPAGAGDGKQRAGLSGRGAPPWARTGVPRGFPVRRRGAYGAPRPAGHGAALPRPLPGPSPGRAPVSGPGRGRERHAYTVEMLGISSGGTSPATGRELKIVRSHDVIAFPGHFFQVADFGNPHSSASDRRHAPGSRCAGPRIRPCRSEHAPPAVSVHPAPAEGGAAHAYHRQNKIPPP